MCAAPVAPPDLQLLILTFIMIGFPAAVITVILVLTGAARRRLIRTWRKLAERTGLEVRVPWGRLPLNRHKTPRLEGNYRGRTAGVEMQWSRDRRKPAQDAGEGKLLLHHALSFRRRDLWLRVRVGVDLPAGGWAFLCDQRYFNDLHFTARKHAAGRWCGRDLFPNGEIALRTDRPRDLARALASEELRRQVAAILDPRHHALMHLAAGQLCWHSGETHCGLDRLLVVLETLCDLAEKLEDPPR